MKQEVIDYMRSQLSDNRWCKDDFERHDLPRLTGNSNDQEFVWAVRPSGTSLVFIDVDTIHMLYQHESSRFFLFRDFYAPLSEIMSSSCNDQSKVFYYDGKELSEIDRHKVWRIYMDKYAGFHEDMVARHFQTYLMRDTPLEIRFMGNTEETVKEALVYAASLDDPSLKECLERLQHYTRVAEKHHIEIYNDFTKYGFTFTEMVNGTPRVTGGIIMHDLPENRWSIHT